MVTSRFGGVSTGDCASFNFSYARDTSREAVDENFRRAAGVFRDNFGSVRLLRSDPYDKHLPCGKKRMQERA